MAGLRAVLLFTGLSHADLDPLHLMYLMVVVVAAVDPVNNMSFTKSGPIWRAHTTVKNRKSHGEDLGIGYPMIWLVP